MNSIRDKLTLRLLLKTSVLIVIASLILAVTVRSRLISEFDNALEAKAMAIVALTSREGSMIEVDFEGDYMPQFGAEESPEYFQVFLQDGVLIRQSESFELEDELVEDDEEIGGTDTDEEGEEEGVRDLLPVVLDLRSGFRFSTIELPDERRGRMAQVTFVPRFDLEPEEEEIESPEDLIELYPIPASYDPEKVKVIVAVAQGLEPLDRLLTYMYSIIGGVDILLLVGTALVSRATVKKGLASIDVINDQIREIDPGASRERISLESPPAELVTIVNALNELLDRSYEAFSRERRFSNAVAHELRTPVAELKMACETGNKWPEDVECARRLFSDNLDIALHMERIVTNLLELTRCDNRTAAISLEEFLVDNLVRECWRRSEEIAESNKLSLEDNIDPKVKIITDKAKLEIMIQNLIDNAIAYSVTGSVIVFSSLSENGGFELVVENETEGLSESDLDRIFERFWRKDPARSGGHHTGLGLSLVKALAELLEIKVSCRLKERNRFQVRLAFPRASIS